MVAETSNLFKLFSFIPPSKPNSDVTTCMKPYLVSQAVLAPSSQEAL